MLHNSLDNKIPFFKSSKLKIEDINKILQKLTEKIKKGENNTNVGQLCLKALENPYLLKKSTFSSWLRLLVKNFDSNIFSDLSTIFARVEDCDKNITEGLLKSFLNNENTVPKTGFGKKFNDAKEKLRKDMREKARKEYYEKGLDVLQNINDLLPEEYDITYSLGNLKNFLDVLSKDSVPDSKNRIETFLLHLFTPGRIRLSFGQGSPIETNTISNIFDLTIDHMTKTEVKREFIERMFSLENCEQIAVNKGKDILEEKSEKYDNETKLFVIDKFSELYKKAELTSDNRVVIQKTITNFFINTEDSKYKEYVYNKFFKILDAQEKESVYRDIMNRAPESFIIEIYKEILNGQDFSQGLKLNCIEKLSSCFSNKKTEENSKTDIKSLMADMLLTYKENEHSICDYIISNFYEETLSEEKDKEEFLKLYLGKYEDSNKNNDKLMPPVIEDDIFKSKVISEDKKKNELINRINSYIAEDEEKMKSTEDFIINHLIDDSLQDDTKKTVLRILLQKAKKTKMQNQNESNL